MRGEIVSGNASRPVKISPMDARELLKVMQELQGSKGEDSKRRPRQKHGPRLGGVKEF